MGCNGLGLQDVAFLNRTFITNHMLELALLSDSDFDDIDVAETDQGKRLTVDDWGTDTDPKLVAFAPASRTCEIVDCEVLADDIGHAISLIRDAALLTTEHPEWFRRLQRYAAGASSLRTARRRR